MHEMSMLDLGSVLFVSRLIRRATATVRSHRFDCHVLKAALKGR